MTYVPTAPARPTLTVPSGFGDHGGDSGGTAPQPFGQPDRERRQRKALGGEAGHGDRIGAVQAAGRCTEQDPALLQRELGRQGIGARAGEDDPAPCPEGRVEYVPTAV